MNVEFKVPQLWKEESFTKKYWGDINLIVGPNGTGKSLFAEQLKIHLTNHGIRTRLLNAERLSGFERNNNSVFGYSNINDGFNIRQFSNYKSTAENYGFSTDAFVVLKEKLDVKIKVEALLSDIFKKTVRLVEEGGFLKPKIQNINNGDEYGLKESECHGLKELITLFTFLYDQNVNCIIFDEPELHLHPQFQSFFLTEVRKLAGNPKIEPSKKCFFIITHSPYFLDFKTIDDLKNLVVCHYNSLPTYIDNLDTDDEWRLKKFLPRFNTHHKQFFFSPNPVFVEGYTDQQIITILFDKLEKNIGASGSSIIDVGGKDELDVFFRLCKKIGVDGRFIADIDAIFAGKLRQTISNDKRCQDFLQNSGIGTNLIKEIGEIESILQKIAERLLNIPTIKEQVIIDLVACLKTFSRPEEIHKVRISVFLAINKFKDKVLAELQPDLNGEINLISGRFLKIIEAFEKCNVFILKDGEIEHYYTQSQIDYLNVSNKDKLFETERDYLLTCYDTNVIELKYRELLKQLLKSVPTIQINLLEHLKFIILEWIQTVQWAVAKGEITSLETLKSSGRTEYALYNQIIEAKDFIIKEDNKFSCKIVIKDSMGQGEREIEFTENTVPFTFKI